MNEALALVAIDGILEIGNKGCYICDGFGHCAEQCPTAKAVRALFSSGDAHSNKVKACITAAIGSMRIKGYIKNMSH